MSASSGDTYARLLAVFDNPAERPAAAPPKDAGNLGGPAKRPADAGDLDDLFELIDVPPPAPPNRIMFPIKAGIHTKTNPLRLRVTSPTDGVGGPEDVIKMWPTTEFGKKKRHVASVVAGKSGKAVAGKSRKAVLKNAVLMGKPIEVLRGGDFVGDVRSTDVSVVTSD